MWQLADTNLESRLLIGSALYPSPAVMQASIAASGAGVVTVSLRRHSPETGGGEAFWQRLRQLNLHLLPNTAGCFSAKSAITTAQMARELFATRWIKLEVIGDDYNLQPDPFGLLEAARALDVPVILDPVMASSSGARFVDKSVVDSLRQHLLPVCDLVTPNCDEAAILSEGPIHSEEEMITAGTRLYAHGETAVVVTGGHLPGLWSRDYCLTPARGFWLNSERQAVGNRRGTGCAFASAAAGAAALGYSLEDAIVIAKMAVNQGLRRGYESAGREGPIHIDRFPDNGRDVPSLTDHAGATLNPAPFPLCGPEPLGLYPVVDSSAWLARLLPLGVATIQLRIKAMAEPLLRDEIQKAVLLSRQYSARLFINDHWQLAVAYGAYGVHLGQDDLEQADLSAIHRAGLRLGVSTHCHYEVARAVGVRPSYLACGPIYATTSKEMPWTPHGLRGLGYWRRVLRDQALVAIGGINGDRLPGVAETGADGIAMITAITGADDPGETTARFVEMLRNHQGRAGVAAGR